MSYEEVESEVASSQKTIKLLGSLGFFGALSGLEETLLFESPYPSRTDLELNLLTINNNCFGLQIWLPGFFGTSKREGHIVPVLLAFAGNITFLHT